MKKMILRTLIVLIATYAVLLGGFYVVMRQRSGVFAQVMAKTPGIAFMAFPFETMWLSARKGHVNVGSEAPDFTLETLAQKSTVRLSSFRGQKLVVLVFGSYT